MISLGHFISHRFRGFSSRENTIDGLLGALDYGVQKLEFDVRVTRCGTPLVYHDEWALDAHGNSRNISKVHADERQSIGGAFAHMPTLDDLFMTIKQHTNKTAVFLVDIKDAGFEEMINALVHAHTLQDRVIYVSWLPNVLYSLHDLAPEIPLCFSHWSQSPDQATRAVHTVYKSQNGIIPREEKTQTHGKRLGWYIDQPIKGDMLAILQKTRGYVCVPYDMSNVQLFAYYQDRGIQVSAFSFLSLDAVKSHRDEYKTDLFFIDNKRAFEALNA